MRHRCLFFFALLFVHHLLFAQQDPRFFFVSEDHTALITGIEESGAIFFPLDEVAQFLGGEITQDTLTDNFVLILSRHSFVLSPERPIISVDSQLKRIEKPPILSSERLYVPTSFFTHILAEALGVPIFVDTRGATVRFGERGSLQVATRYRLEGEKGILVIRPTQTIPYRIERKERELRVVFPEHRIKNTGRQQLGDRLVRSLQRRNGSVGGEIAIRLGPDFQRYRATTEDQPFRLLLTFESTSSPWQPLTRGISRIVIDPGHGGTDTGAIGAAGLQEKLVTLDIARKIQRILEERHRINSVLTRTSDQFLSLDNRTAFANQQGADLFVSIHSNASLRGSANGSETYFLSLEATDEATRLLTLRENTGSGPIPQDPSSKNDLEMVLWNMVQTQYLEESSRLAEMIQDRLNILLGTESRGIKQAPFTVLMGINMPAVLIEVAFISNQTEEGKLQQDAFREEIARAIATGLSDFKRYYDRKVRAASFRDPP